MADIEKNKYNNRPNNHNIADASHLFQKKTYKAQAKTFSTNTQGNLPKISCFTTCMGRRHHLEETFLKNIKCNKDYPGAEFVLLDYNSNDQLGDWIQSEFYDYIKSGLLAYYRYTENDFFSYSHSKNLAARLCRGDIICNLDADNTTEENFLFYIEENMRTVDFMAGCDYEDGVFIPIKGDHGVTGRMAIRKKHFIEIGGYDETMVSWGYEDIDLFNRLHLTGLTFASIDPRFLGCLAHENEERVVNTEEKNIGRNMESTSGSLLNHRRKSHEMILNGKIIRNRGKFGCGVVTRNFTQEKISLEPLTPDSKTTIKVDIKKINNSLLKEEFKNGAANMAAIPNILFIELTRRCNLSCPMCRPEDMTGPDLDMSEAVIKRIEEELLPTARLVDLRGWGESLVRNDFIEILERFSLPGIQLRLLSNGTMNKPEVWQQLMRKNAWAGISIDSIKEENLLALRGARLNAIESSLKSLIHWRDKYGNNPETVFLTVTVSSKNIFELNELLIWANDLGVGRIHMIPISCRPNDEKNLCHCEPHISPVLEKLYENSNKLEIKLQFGASLSTDLVMPDYLLKNCMHPWMYAYINYAGDVGFCDHLIGRDDLTAGNLLQTPFKEIWNRPSLMSLRTSHFMGYENHPLREHCNWCFKNRYADFEHEIQTDFLSNVVANTTVSSFC